MPRTRTLSPLTPPPASQPDAPQMTAWGFPPDPSAPDPSRPYLAPPCTHCKRARTPCHIPPLTRPHPPLPDRQGVLVTLARGACAACVGEGIACSEDSARRRWFVEVREGDGPMDRTVEAGAHERDQMAPHPRGGRFRALASDDDGSDLPASLWPDEDAPVVPDIAVAPEHDAQRIAETPDAPLSLAVPDTLRSLSALAALIERNDAQLAAVHARCDELEARLLRAERECESG
ncbi:hypothetical protein Q8F55_001506 [Vanrija albida]|uniref:Zn(2)-C6 fungal-type domain-containing protein n=1 Tax=Vanrija albida TaxID=181172 RepID=A0ABR3QG94_9TREE